MRSAALSNETLELASLRLELAAFLERLRTDFNVRCRIIAAVQLLSFRIFQFIHSFLALLLNTTPKIPFPASKIDNLIKEKLPTFAFRQRIIENQQNQPEMVREISHGRPNVDRR